MKFEEYKENVKRTLPQLGSLLLDSIHMTLGMGSEVGEVIEAIEKGDKVNIGEELTDIAWYACNYCNIYDIDLSSVSLCNSPFAKDNEDLFKSKFINLVECISKLLDYDKKELCYKKETSKEIKRHTIGVIISTLNKCYMNLNLNPEQCMQNNIDKLKIRYPNAFNIMDAVNRNLEEERKQLEK